MLVHARMCVYAWTLRAPPLDDGWTTKGSLPSQSMAVSAPAQWGAGALGAWRTPHGRLASQFARVRAHRAGMRCWMQEQHRSVRLVAEHCPRGYRQLGQVCQRFGASMSVDLRTPAHCGGPLIHCHIRSRKSTASRFHVARLTGPLRTASRRCVRVPRRRCKYMTSAVFEGETHNELPRWRNGPRGGNGDSRTADRPISGSATRG